MTFIFIIFVVATIIQLGFYIFAFGKLALYKQSSSVEVENKKFAAPISVVICAKNEAENLTKNLPYILTQHYPSFEVVVVNDRSTDNTAKLLADYKKNYKNLTIVTIQQEEVTILSGKKHALRQGILATKSAYLLLTDADCCPNSLDWIQIMSNHFTTNKQIVLGYAPYYASNTFLNKCVQFETVYTALQYLSFALIRHPYMGVGRNLAYHKSLFVAEHSFDKHANLLSGDDDLFVQAIANRTNTTIALSKASFCYSAAPTTWKAWYQQKTRHLSTGKHYRLGTQILLGLLSLSHFLFYGMLIANIYYRYNLIGISVLFGIRMTIQLWVFRKVLHHLDNKNMWWLIPILDAFYIFFYLVFAPSLFCNKTITWKQ